MKFAKIVFNCIIVIFLISGIYFKITDQVAKGAYVDRWGGNWHNSVITANSLLFFAIVFIGCRIWIGKLDKLDSEKVDKPKKK